MFNKIQFSKVGLVSNLPHLVILALVVGAAAVLGWVGWLTWIDITNWGKDFSSIFFGSRTGEPISLGIGMTVFNYFLIGILLLSSGIALFVIPRIKARRAQQPMQARLPKVNNQQKMKMPTAVKRNGKENNGAAREEVFFSGCLHHFGYLSNRPKDSPIPQECILCQRLGDCMVATIYVKKASE